MRSRIMQRRAFLGVCLAIPIAMAGCSPAPAATTSSPAPASSQPVTLKIGLPGVATNPYGIVYVARDQGFFKKYNLSVDVTEYQGAGPEQEALAAGDADIISFVPASVALAIKKGVKEKIVTTYQYRPVAWHLMTAAGSAIKTPQDLNGKKVGISGKGTATDMLSLWYAKQNGIQIESVPLGGQQATYAQMLAGQVDAAIITSPFSLRGLANGEARSLFDYGKEMPANSFDTLVASEAIIQSQPAAVGNYLKGIFEAVTYLKQNRAAAIDIMSKYTKTDQASAQRDYDTIIQAMPEKVEVNKEWLQNALDLAALAGVTDVAPVDQIYTTQFVGQ